MESSFLLTDTINIEQERWNLQQSGCSWDEIKETLNSKYRESSKKKLFRCECCNSTTFLVLSQDRACFFKHESKDECVGSRNYARYTANKNALENKKHRVGKAIIKDQLLVNLSKYGAKIYDGYLYREELKFIPDLVIEWQSGEIWTIDYVTGTKSAQYQGYLMKKQELYLSKGFKSYLFFDHSQIVHKPEQNALALSEGEKGALRFLSRVNLWEGLLSDLSDRLGAESLVADSRLMLENQYVHQHIYVTDDISGVHYKISQIRRRMFESFPEIPDRWYMIVGKENQLTTNELLSYNQQDHVFTWEKAEVSAEELNVVVLAAELRYDAIKLEEAKREKARLIKEEQERQRRRNAWEDQKVGHFTSSYSSGHRMSESVDVSLTKDQDKADYFQSVITRMKNTPALLKASPGFIDRIKECESDIEKFKSTGVLPDRIYPLIRMMVTALGA